MAKPSLDKLKASLVLAGIAAEDAQEQVSKVAKDIRDLKKAIEDIKKSVNDNISGAVLKPNEDLRKGKDDVKDNKYESPRIK